MLQGRKEGLLPGRRGAQVEDRLAHVGVRFGDRTLQVRELVVRLVQLAIGDQLPGCPHLEAGEAQHLADPVVQLARQLLALAEHGQRPLLLDDLRLGALLLGDVTQHEQVAQEQPAKVVERGDVDLVGASARPRAELYLEWFLRRGRKPPRSGCRTQAPIPRVSSRGRSPQ